MAPAWAVIEQDLWLRHCPKIASVMVALGVEQMVFCCWSAPVGHEALSERP